LVYCPWCGVNELIVLNKISRRSPAVISASVSDERRTVFRVAGVVFRWFVDAAALLGVNAVAIAFVNCLFVGEAGVGVAFFATKIWACIELWLRLVKVEEKPIGSSVE
jgi:hypothetical protein